MMNIQSRSDISDNQLIDIAASLRSDGVEIEAGLTKDIYDSGKYCESHFEVKEMEFDVRVDGEVKTQVKPIVLCKDVSNFVEFVKTERKVENPVMCRYGLDGGGMHTFEIAKN